MPKFKLRGQINFQIISLQTFPQGESNSNQERPLGQRKTQPVNKLFCDLQIKVVITAGKYNGAIALP